MVMGWRAYQEPEPLETPEMALLTDYLEADCRALLAVLRWMRQCDTMDKAAGLVGAPEHCARTQPTTGWPTAVTIEPKRDVQ